MRCAVIAKLGCLVLVCALSGASGTQAQDVPPAPPAEQAPVTPPAALPAEVPVTQPAAPPAEVPVTHPAPVSVVPPPPPPASAVVYQAAPTRVVFLAPRARAVRPHTKPVYGDAGAPFAIGAGLSFSWPTDAAYQLTGRSDTLTQGEVFVSYDVWQPVKRLVLSSGVHFRSLIGDEVDRAEVSERALQAELTARYTLASWFFPHLRAAGGGVRTSLRINDERSYRDNQRVSYEDTDWAFLGTFGAGFTLRTKARAFESDRGRVSSLSLGVLVEGGYTLSPAAKLKLDPVRSPASGLDVKTGQAGSLDRSAPYLRVAGVIRF
jgi:hypothetical protein